MSRGRCKSLTRCSRLHFRVGVAMANSGVPLFLSKCAECMSVMPILSSSHAATMLVNQMYAMERRLVVVQQAATLELCQ